MPKILSGLTVGGHTAHGYVRRVFVELGLKHKPREECLPLFNADTHLCACIPFLSLPKSWPSLKMPIQTNRSFFLSVSIGANRLITRYTKHA